MKHITFYFDLISPFAYLAFEQLPKALAGCSYQVSYKPVLFAGMLQAHGQLGPAEIASKRQWTYRHVLWLAHAHGIELQMPATHPFNPLGLQRLAVAMHEGGCPNRVALAQLFQHVWCTGEDAADPARLTALVQQLRPPREPDSVAVKAQLRAFTEEAIAKGVFGVPTFDVDGRLFWGVDALPMLASYLQHDPWFESNAWQQVDCWPVGIQRKR